MKTEYIKGNALDHSKVAAYIPEVMNALYDSVSFESTSLTEMRDAFRMKQIQGKTWLLNSGLLDHCLDKSKSVLVVGSWFGFTSFCLHKLGFSNVTEVDPDSRLEHFAKHLNRFNKQYTHITADINTVDMSSYDIVVNPSGEHIVNNTWFDNIKTGATVIIHSTDYPASDHVNTCQQQDELLSRYKMLPTFLGTLDLQTYKRFMIVGIKT
jgi:protein-L-isoaspartate O-methyltransferase